ncbi:MAG TPA: hypothetical protein VFJ58_28925, partial [Armatimonadota bacterium]|nr:hypothetical protein [Armatimonadota bacterium]
MVTYTSDGTWSQDDLNGSPYNPATASSGNWSDTVGETSGGNSAGGQYSVDAMTWGSVTATITWWPTTGMTMAQDPPSSQVLLQETATAHAAGGVGNGSGDTASDGIGSTGNDTRYDVEDGSSGVITVHDNLSASTPIAPGPPYDAGAAEVSVSYSVAPTPVEVDFTGATFDGNGYDILTGQELTAYLIPENYPGATYVINNWSWTTASPDAFENYDHSLLDSKQLVALTTDDRTQWSFNYYTKSAGDAKATCTATVTCPDGTLLDVTATRSLNSLKPTGTVEVNGPDAPAQFTPTGWDPFTGTDASYIGAREDWWPATV